MLCFSSHLLILSDWISKTLKIGLFWTTDVGIKAGGREDDVYYLANDVIVTCLGGADSLREFAGDECDRVISGSGDGFG
jgi:hypothetical protein